MTRPKHIVGVEAGAVFLFAALAAVALYRLVASLHESFPLPQCAVAVLAGWLAADLASGLVHWFADTFCEEDAPWIGPLLIQPFRQHHRDPQAMTRHGFLELTGNSCLVLLPVLGASLAVPLSLAGQAAVLAFALGLFATNLFHKWAHDAAPPLFVSWLQSCWIILPPAHHTRHHSAPEGAAYCVTTGWANTLVEACGAFAVLRRLLLCLRVPAARRQS